MKKFLADVCKKENSKTDKDILNIMQELDNLCVHYFTGLSEKLSESEYVTQEEIFDKLNELIK